MEELLSELKPRAAAILNLLTPAAAEISAKPFRSQPASQLAAQSITGSIQSDPAVWKQTPFSPFGGEGGGGVHLTDAPAVLFLAGQKETRELCRI